MYVKVKNRFLYNIDIVFYNSAICQFAFFKNNFQFQKKDIPL